MNRFRRTKPLAAVITIASMLLILVLVGSAQVSQMDQATCKQKKGTWIKSNPVGVNGDGTSHVSVSVNGPDGLSVLGGQVSGYRDGIDDKFTFTCLMNPAQPPTVENSEQRRCTPPGNDMSVEKCEIIGSQVSCEYVNSKGAPVKRVVMGVCFADSSAAVQSQERSILATLVSGSRSIVAGILHRLIA